MTRIDPDLVAMMLVYEMYAQAVEDFRAMKRAGYIGPDGKIARVSSRRGLRKMNSEDMETAIYGCRSLIRNADKLGLDPEAVADRIGLKEAVR